MFSLAVQNLQANLTHVFSALMRYVNKCTERQQES